MKFFNDLLFALATVLLSYPTLWEWYNDRKGDFDKGADVIVRVSLMLLVAAYPWYFGRSWIASANLSFAFFFLAFDYGINYILGRKPVFEYLSKSKVDKIVDEVLQYMGWKWVMGVRVFYFLIACFLYAWL